jgi:hypothetical protein
MSSRDLQYRKKDSEDHLPVTLTTSGGVPVIRSSVMPPVQELCPVRWRWPRGHQMLLQHCKKDVLSMTVEQSDSLKEKSRLFFGILLMQM